MRKALCILALIAAGLLAGGCSVGDERWRAEAERPTFDEWAAASCATLERVTQVEPGYFNARAYRIEVRDGDNSYGERCELSQGNTSASNIRRVGGARVLFHSGDQLIVHFAYKIPSTGFAFHPSCSNVSICEDGGLIHQIKQLGSCGTPALGIVATGRGMFVRNSAGNYCESGAMRSILSFPLVRDKWVQVAQLVKFSTDPAVGYYGLWTKVEDESWVWRGGVNTHTMKSPTDHPAGSCDEPTPCSHARIGIYRDPDVTGTSHAFFDGVWVAEWDGSHP